MLKPQVLARAIPTTLALALLACQQPLPTAKLAVTPTTQPESLTTARPDAPKRKLMTVSQDVWNALAADWPELGADGVDDLVNLKAFELEQSTASLNASGSDPGVSLAVSTSAGWVYLENADPVSIHALEQDVYRQADSTQAAQGYRLQAVPYSPPFKYSYSSLVSTSLYGNLWHPMPEYVGYDYAYGILSCDLAQYQSFLNQFGGTTHLALCFGRGTPDPFVGCGKFFQTQQYTLPDGTKTSGFGAAAGSGNYYSQINLPGPWTIVKGAAVRGGSTSFTAYFDCSIHKTFNPKPRNTEGRLLANAALTPDELASGARKANGATRVTAPSGGRVTMYRDPVTGEFKTTAGPALGTGVRPAPTPSPTPTATPSTSVSASPTVAPSFAPSEAPSPSPTPTPLETAQPSPNPSSTSTPLPLKLNAELSFSPNGDGANDSLNINVSAPGAWRLDVSGLGTIQSGSANASFVWDGKIDNNMVQAGRYTINLTDAVTGNTVHETIIIESPLGINAALNSFSPNGDGVNDVNKITFINETSEPDWIFSIDGIGPISRGSDAGNVQWTGWGSKGKLTPGTYTLRLKTRRYQATRAIAITDSASYCYHPVKDKDLSFGLLAKTEECLEYPENTYATSRLRGSGFEFDPIDELALNWQSPLWTALKGDDRKIESLQKIPTIPGSVLFTVPQLQHMWKASNSRKVPHCNDFGVFGKDNGSNRVLLRQNIVSHIKACGDLGRYHGQYGGYPVWVFLNPVTHVVAIIDGQLPVFVTGYKIGFQQESYFMRTGEIR